MSPSNVPPDVARCRVPAPSHLSPFLPFIGGRVHPRCAAREASSGLGQPNTSSHDHRPLSIRRLEVPRSRRIARQRRNRCRAIGAVSPFPCLGFEVPCPPSKSQSCRVPAQGLFFEVPCPPQSFVPLKACPPQSCVPPQSFERARSWSPAGRQPVRGQAVKWGGGACEQRRPLECNTPLPSTLAKSVDREPC